MVSRHECGKGTPGDHDDEGTQAEGWRDRLEHLAWIHRRRYLAAAGFNTAYTLPHQDELGGYAEGAWFPFLKDFMWDVFMPNGELFMSLVIAFEIAVGLLILSRGTYVDMGVGASVLWVLVVLPFLAWPYLLTNIVLALLQGVLFLRRYDRAIWDLVRNPRRQRGAPHPS